MGVRIHFLVPEGLVCWSQVYTICRERTGRLCGSPLPHLHLPSTSSSIAQFLQLHRAGQVTQQLNHSKGERGVGSSLDSDRRLCTRGPQSEHSAERMVRGPQG